MNFAWRFGPIERRKAGTPSAWRFRPRLQRAGAAFDPRRQLG
jgi:hypothetical protein